MSIVEKLNLQLHNQSFHTCSLQHKQRMVDLCDISINRLLIASVII